MERERRTLPGVAEPRTAGLIVRQHVTALRERFGAATIDGAIRSLAPDARTAILGLEAWVPVSAMDALYTAVAERLGRDAADLHWETGRTVVTQTFKTVWRVLLRFTSDEALVARTSIFYSKAFDQGLLSARMVAPGRGELELTGWPEGAPSFVRRGLRIGISTVLELSGRKSVRIRDEQRGEKTVFFASWAP